MKQKVPNRKVGKGNFAALISAAVFAAVAVMLPTLVESPNEWVGSHSDQLPQSYHQLSSFPVDYRMRIVAELPFEAQVRLWKAHLENVLQTRPQLNAGQQRLIRQAMQWATVENFQQARQSTGENPNALKDLAWQIDRLYDRQEAWEIFYQLGPSQPTYQSAASWPIWASETVSGFFSSSARGIKCNCSVGFPLPPTCANAVCASNPTCVSAACGPFVVGPCNGCC